MPSRRASSAWSCYQQIPGLHWMLKVHGLPETADALADGIEGLVHIVRWDPVDEPGPPPMPSDLACTCGTFLRTHATQAHLIAGLDHSETLVGLVREQNRRRIEDGAAESVVDDVTALPWGDGTFTVVTSNDVGCYEPRVQPVIEEMYRVLRSGGRAVVADDRHKALEDAGFAEVGVEPLLRFGRITTETKPQGEER